MISKKFSSDNYRYILQSVTCYEISKYQSAFQISSNRLIEAIKYQWIIIPDTITMKQIFCYTCLKLQ